MEWKEDLWIAQGKDTLGSNLANLSNHRPRFPVKIKIQRILMIILQNVSIKSDSRIFFIQ